jgi:hypothetical protein
MAGCDLKGSTDLICSIGAVSQPLGIDQRSRANSYQPRSFVGGIPAKENGRTNPTAIHGVDAESVCFVLGEPEGMPTERGIVGTGRHPGGRFVCCRRETVHLPGSADKILSGLIHRRRSFTEHFFAFRVSAIGLWSNGARDRDALELIIRVDACPCAELIRGIIRPLSNG